MLATDRLAFITRISDRILVLANGRPLAEGSPEAIRADPAVDEAYLRARAVADD